MMTVTQDRVADSPIDTTGANRSDVRLLVATPDGLLHRRFADIGQVLRPGDLLVVNTSATLPAAVPVAGTSERLVHLSGRQADGRWMIELRRACGLGSEPDDAAAPGMDVRLPAGGRLKLVHPVRAGSQTSQRLWVADLVTPTATLDWLHRVGRPIRYGCATTAWPLSAYQTVFAAHPGSAEMPSAGRPFTDRLVTELVSAGVEIAPLVLHTGVSSLERGEDPYPEWFAIPEATAARVNHARAARQRVIAVGTTVVRALESAVDGDGYPGDGYPGTATTAADARVHAGSGWTDLVITAEHGVRMVDGLITGWHEQEATHLDMLEAVAGRRLVEASYAAAAAGGYRWHEFGDSHLLLPGKRR